jgi:hypothetical protein
MSTEINVVRRPLAAQIILMQRKRERLLKFHYIVKCGFCLLSVDVDLLLRYISAHLDRDQGLSRHQSENGNYY